MGWIKMIKKFFKGLIEEEVDKDLGDEIHVVEAYIENMDREAVEALQFMMAMSM